ncbi:hypothetical protein QJS66_23620 (plasmid) [Kocuria rhizophila]|nr:hypothetical protein QJS66_23620 [Kocuria rhizophila]
MQSLYPAADATAPWTSAPIPRPQHVRSLGHAQAPVRIADTGEHWS